MQKSKYHKRIIDMGKKVNSRLILPECSDNRIIEASKKLSTMGFIVLRVEDFNNKIDVYLEYISRLSFTKNWPIKNLKEYLNNPLHFSLAMLACGDADGLIAGAITPSSNVIKAAIRMIGIRNDFNSISSIFFMISPDSKQAFTFGDCAVIPEPTSRQLAEIGAGSAEMHQLLTGEEAMVAFLSFSTKGSASHYRVDKVREAVKIFAKEYPHIIHDGEIQLDAAIVPEINRRKVTNSPLEEGANVLIFPDLDAGNIAYKITERLAGFSAYGPLIQGLNKPVHDLSRGCSVNDIINVSAIAALQKDMYANI